MQSLINGADCSTSSNPLNQVLKREGADNSLFRDRVDGPSAQRTSRPFASAPIATVPHVSHPSSVPHPFNLSHLAATLAKPPSPAHANPVTSVNLKSEPHLATEWEHYRTQSQQWDSLSPSGQISEADRRLQSTTSPWAHSFMVGKGKGRADASSRPTYRDILQPYPSHPPNPFGQLPTYQPRFQSAYATSSPPMEVSQAHNAAAHAEMEAAFERALADARAQADGTEDPTESLREIDQIPHDGETERDFKGELEAVWESLRPEAERLNQLAEWEKDFSQFTSGEDDTFDILNESLNRHDIGQTSLDDQLEFGMGLGADRSFETRPPVEISYQMTTLNKFDNRPPIEAWQEAMRLLASGGSLSDGALLIESFLARATDEDYSIVGVSRARAWSVLARTQAENEMEDKALAAFEQGRQALSIGETDHQVAGELLTNLAISFVNESQDFDALSTLHQLLTIIHPVHAGPAPSRDELVADNPWTLHQRMTTSYLELAREQYSRSGQVDANVQVGLGTLYYMMGDFGEARGCWTAALGERPEDYLLWNRLGATLANSGDPEQAVDAYRRALEIRPTYTRAIYNLGVACLNIGVYREAAEHFLAALSLQPPNDGASPTESHSLWWTLRRALIALDMPKLAEEARPGTDLSTFRHAGFEF